MTEISRFWDGQVLGDCGPYTSNHMHDQFFRSILNGTGDQGVLLGWLNGLEVSGTSSPVTVATGGAIVYGLFYENDAAVSVNVPTPTGGALFRYDRIVVRRLWGAQTCRVAIVGGTDDGPPPSLTQTAGVQWEIPLAYAYIENDGSITITDDRDYCTFSTQWAANTANDADFFQDGAVTAAKIPDRTRYFIKEAAQLEPDSTNAPAWTVGASYDYWQFADAVTDAVWLYDFVPRDQAGTTIGVYLWSVPDAAAAATVRWRYNYSLNSAETSASFTAGNTDVDQTGRVNTTVYRDLLCTLPSATEGQMIMLQVSRLGGDAADTFGNDMRLLGVELNWTAEA